MKHFDTLVDTLNDLKSRGYTIDFNLKKNQLISEEGIMLDPHEFEIDEIFRFEGKTDPDDNAILYAISSHHGKKGVLVNAYGVYADDESSEIIAKLSSHH